jgi:hypothetical protein
MINMTVVMPYVQLVAVISKWMTGDYSPTLLLLTELVAAQFITLAVWWKVTQAHRAGINWVGYFTMPLGGIAVTILYLHAAYMVLSGSKVNWKGRHYRVNTHKTIEPQSVANRKHLETSAFGSESGD